MALSSAQIQARIDAIRAARDSGVLIVRHGDESTQFRNLAEMNSIIKDLEGALDEISTETRPRISYIEQRTKGY